MCGTTYSGGQLKHDIPSPIHLALATFLSLLLSPVVLAQYLALALAQYLALALAQYLALALAQYLALALALASAILALANIRWH